MNSTDGGCVVVAMRRRLNKVSFQITDDQLAFLQARKTRLGLTSDTESLRDALNKLMAIEARESESLAAEERARALESGAFVAEGGGS